VVLGGQAFIGELKGGPQLNLWKPSIIAFGRGCIVSINNKKITERADLIQAVNKWAIPFRFKLGGKVNPLPMDNRFRHPSN
jgi:hypothetical protein